jgi:hypothetical protein
MATPQRVDTTSAVFEFLLTRPTPEQILNFRLDEETDDYLQHLMDKNQNGLLTSDERAEMEEFSRINHFMIRLKAHAHLAIKNGAAQR